METVLTIALCTCLVMIIVQDFRQRAVGVLWLALTLVIQVTSGIYQSSVKDFFTFLGINLVVLAIQIGMLYLFFAVKNRKFTSLIDQSIGKGDLFFFVILTSAFSPINFILFYITALFMTLLISLFFYRKKLIPLAGWLAVFFLPVVLLSLLPGSIQPYIDILIP